MKVFFLRHGTRHFDIGDIPLNHLGLAEAQSLAKQPLLLQCKTLISSPKKRAQMTLEPLAEKLQTQILIEERLDQHHSSEPHEHFLQRIKKLVIDIEAGHWLDPLVICSHSDWLSLACDLIASDDSSLSFYNFHCAEFIGFEIEDGLWKRLS